MSTTAEGNNTAACGVAKTPNCRICCACPAERRLRDECTILKGVDNCRNEMEAFYTCLLREGFSEADQRGGVGVAVVKPKKKKRKNIGVCLLEGLLASNDELLMGDRQTPRAFSSTQHEQLADTMARGGRKRSKVVVFPCFRDRLACDPMNYFCAYADHEFTLRDSFTEAERSICALVDEMVAAVTSAFEEAMVYWRTLSSSVQLAHALRALTSLPMSPLNLPLLHADGSSHVSRRSMDLPPSGNGRSGAINRQNSILSSMQQIPTPQTTLRGAHSERRDEEGHTILKSLEQQWHPPHNGPRCRLVLDIVASRKTLGDDPPNSKPYQLGEKVFQYAQTKYHAVVTSTFVGISDSSSMLVGRDILYPYRMTGSSGINKGALTGGVRSSSRPNMHGMGATDAALATTNIANATAAGNVTMLLCNLDQVLTNTIPVPRMMMIPPTNTDKVDNVRLVVCTPSIRGSS